MVVFTRRYLLLFSLAFDRLAPSWRLWALSSDVKESGAPPTATQQISTQYSLRMTSQRAYTGKSALSSCCGRERVCPTSSQPTQASKRSRAPGL